MNDHTLYTSLKIFRSLYRSRGLEVEKGMGVSGTRGAVLKYVLGTKKKIPMELARNKFLHESGHCQEN